MSRFQIISKAGHVLAVAALAMSFYAISPQTAGWQVYSALIGWAWFSAIAESIPIIDFQMTKNNTRLHPNPDLEWNLLKRQVAADIFGWNFLGIILFAWIKLIY